MTPDGVRQQIKMYFDGGLGLVHYSTGFWWVWKSVAIISTDSLNTCSSCFRVKPCITHIQLMI